MNHLQEKKEVSKPNPFYNNSGTGNKLKDYASWVPICIALLYTVFNLVFVGPSGNFPLNDSNFYAHPVQNLLETGILRLDASLATAYLHVALGALVCKIFGFSFEVLRLETYTVAILSILAMFLVLRELRVKRSTAGLIALVLAVNPIFVNLSFTFMTDILFICLTLFYTLFSLKAIKFDSQKSLLAANFFLVASFFVRQINIIYLVPNLVISAYFFFSSKRRKLASILSTLFLPVAGYLSVNQLTSFVMTNQNFLKLRTNQLIETVTGYFLNPQIGIPLITKEILESFFYLGLFTAPILVCCFARLPKNWKAQKYELLASASLAAASTIYMLSLIFRDPPYVMPYNPNLFKINELGPNGLIGVSTFESNVYLEAAITLALAPLSWLLCYALFLISTKLISNAIGKLSRPQKLATQKTKSITLNFFIWSMFTTTLLWTALFMQVKPFDRYYLSLLPSLLMVLAIGFKYLRHQKRFLLASILVLSLGYYSSTSQQHYMSWNRARWIALDKAIESGIELNKIDTGAEGRNYPNWKISSVINLEKGTHILPENTKGRPPQNQWRWWPVTGDDYIITHVPTKYYKTLFKIPYWSSFMMKEKNIYFQKREKNL